MNKLLLTVVVLYVATSGIEGYKFFQQRIPNGDKVVNPCDGTIWQGVGHENYGGGGVRNPFGKVITVISGVTVLST